MATWNKFNQFVKDVVDGIHDFDNDVFKVMLTNVAPVATNTVKANLTEIANGNGYTTGGATTAITTSLSTATAKITPADVVFTAAGGAMATFRYAVLYNDTKSGDPLVGWADYGAGLTLNDTEFLTVDFDGTNGLLTLT